MDRQELIKDLKAFNGGGGTITKTKIAEYLNISRNNHSDLYKYIQNLKYIPYGNGPKFFIPDVATRIIENTVVYVEEGKQ